MNDAPRVFHGVFLEAGICRRGIKVHRVFTVCGVLRREVFAAFRQIHPNKGIVTELSTEIISEILTKIFTEIISESLQ